MNITSYHDFLTGKTVQVCGGCGEKAVVTAKFMQEQSREVIEALFQPENFIHKCKTPCEWTSVTVMGKENPVEFCLTHKQLRSICKGEN